MPRFCGCILAMMPFRLKALHFSINTELPSRINFPNAEARGFHGNVLKTRYSRKNIFRNSPSGTVFCRKYFMELSGAAQGQSMFDRSPCRNRT